MTAADHGQTDPGRTDPPPKNTGGQAASATRSETGRIDAALVAELYDRYAEEIGSFLKGVLRNSDLAAEALQNTFAKAVESGHTAREETLKGWLFRVAFHEAALLRRRGQVHERSLRQMARNSPAANDIGRATPRAARTRRNTGRSSPGPPGASAGSATSGRRCGFMRRSRSRKSPPTSPCPSARF